MSKLAIFDLLILIFTLFGFAVDLGLLLLKALIFLRFRMREVIGELLKIGNFSERFDFGVKSGLNTKGEGVRE